MAGYNNIENQQNRAESSESQVAKTSEHLLRETSEQRIGPVNESVLKNAGCSNDEIAAAKVQVAKFASGQIDIERA